MTASTAARWTGETADLWAVACTNALARKTRTEREIQKLGRTHDGFTLLSGQAVSCTGSPAVENWIFRMYTRRAAVTKLLADRGAPGDTASSFTLRRPFAINRRVPTEAGPPASESATSSNLGPCI